MLSLLLLYWAVLYTTATCYHLQQTSLPSGANAADPETHQWLEAKSYFIKKEGNKRAQKPVRRGSDGNFDYWKDQYKSCFSILDMKSHAFLCLDSKGKLYTSVFDSNKDCRFLRVKRHKHYDVFHSCRGDVLLVSHQQVKIHKSQTHRRKRRSWHTDPSDPLGSEYPRSSPTRIWRSDPEHGGHVSKETITSVDDPLEVLLSHSAQTPMLEKHRKNRKVRF